MKKSFCKMAINSIMLNLKLGSLYFIFLLFINQSFSQSKNFSYTVYNKSSGLNLSDEVADVKIDFKGQLWIVTFSGIYKYTGEVFSKINTTTVFHNSFTKFFETAEGQAFVIDVNGAIYFINSDSLISFIGNDSIRALNVTRKVADIDITVDSITISLFGKGLIQFDIKEGLSSVKPKTKFELGYTILFRQNKSPIVIRNGYNRRLNNVPSITIADWKTPIISQVELDPPKTWFKNSILKLTSNQYLFSTGEGQLFLVDKSGKVKEVHFKHSILNLFKDSHNNVWVSTSKNGVFIYKASDLSFKYPNQILENESFVITAEDNEGNIWGYSEKQGVLKINNPIYNINSKYHLEGLPPQVQSIGIAEELLFFSNLSGVCGFQNLDTEKIVFFNKQIPQNEIVDFKYFKKEDRVYFTARGELGYFNEKWDKVTLFSSEHKPFLGGRNLHFAKRQEANNHLIGFYRNKFFTFKNKSILSISDDFSAFVREVFAFKDSTFVAADNYLFLESNGRRINFTQSFPKLGNNVVDMIRFNGKIWISTLTGLFVVNNRSIERINLLGKSPTEAKLLKESKQELWVFSTEGSFLIDLNKNTAEVYQKLPKVEISNLLCYDGSIFIETKRDGVLNVKFDDLRKFPIMTPPLYIRKLAFGNFDYTTQIDSTIELSHFENSIQLDFFSVNFSTEKLNFRYRIFGLDSTWNSTKSNSLNVFGIPPGSYKLELQSRVGQQFWSKTSSISFTISPPIWKTWWFIIGVVFIIILLFFYFFKLRMRVVRREESLIISRLKSEQKALRTRMDPHFIFNIISSLQYLIIKKNNEDASAFLNRFAIIMRNNLKQTESDKISLEDEIQFLKEYIALEKMRYENHFSFTIKIDHSIDQNTMIPTFLIQPLVENSIKHGFEHFSMNISINVSFKLIDGFLIVEVEDDGLGYNKSIEKKADIKYLRKDSYGLNTIKERIVLYNGNIKEESFELIDLKNTGAKKSGTLVRIRIKLN